MALIGKAGLERELSKVERELADYRARAGTSRAAAASSAVADEVVSLETDWSRLLRTVEEARERVSSLESRVFTAEITSSSEFTDAAQLSVVDGNRTLTVEAADEDGISVNLTATCSRT